MPTVIKKGFNNIGVQVQPEIKEIEISEDVLQTLSRLFGWDGTNELFRAIRVDSDGALIVSSQQLKAETVIQSIASLTTTASSVLGSNGDRKAVLLQNNTSTDIYFAMGSTFTLASAIKLAAGAAFSDDLYTGDITAATASGTADLLVVEYE